MPNFMGKDGIITRLLGLAIMVCGLFYVIFGGSYISFLVLTFLGLSVIGCIYLLNIYFPLWDKNDHSSMIGICTTFLSGVCVIAFALGMLGSLTVVPHAAGWIFAILGLLIAIFSYS
jgi:hypothetical protein